jgi:hypothetical protein
VLYGSKMLWWNCKTSRTSIFRLGLMAHDHNPANFPKFKYKAWWYSIDRKFHADLNIRHDGFYWLEISCWFHFAVFHLFHLEITEKSAPWFRGNTEFPIYSSWKRGWGHCSGKPTLYKKQTMSSNPWTNGGCCVSFALNGCITDKCFP